MIEQDITKLTNDQGKIVESQPMPITLPFKDNVEIFRLKYLSDNLKIVGFLLRPAHREENQKLPAVVYNRPGIGDSHKIDEET